MTDTFGSEPPDHEAGHDEVLRPESEAVHEAPSEFEYGDPDSADHAASYPLEGEKDEESKTARRSPILPIAAAVGGLVLLGGVAWWQLGSLSPPTPPSPLAPAAMPLPATVSDAQKPAVLPVAPRTASVEEKAPLAGALPSPVSGVAPDVANSKPSASEPESILAAALQPKDATESQKPLPEATAPAPVKPAIPVSPAVAPSPVAAASAPVLSPLAPAALNGESTDSRIETLAARVDKLKNALDQINQQLGQMTSAIATANVGASSTPSVKDLQDQIDKLQQQLADLNAKYPEAAPVTSLRPESPVLVSKPSVAASSRHAHKTHKEHSQTAVSRHVKHVKKAPREATVENKWVLRAATPGQAWVATSPTSPDLKQLKVGDKLPGIGNITAIQQDGGVWIVQGTKGSVK
ncbi:MAG: hypothetical protein P4M13_11885 [Alphaproteobacteria bacterium]|nr:hypothetical protein [Alphaproteobacteria bacterium]